jgi:hypothetical protein
MRRFYPRRVGTYVQRGSKFCFVVLVGVTDIAQNTALLSNFTMLSAYCTIACTFARQPCSAALPGSLARQPCPAALPGSLARQPCPAALPSSLARQPGPAALPGSLARQPCRHFTSLITGRRPAELQAFYGRRPACSIAKRFLALPGSIARQPCPATLPGSLARQPCPAALHNYYMFNNRP